jgi:hypothetical protein
MNGMRESDGSPERPRPGRSEPHGSQAKNREASNNGLADLYRVAYVESQRTLDDQQDELKGMRDRAVSFTAFVGAATAFLVGTGLHATNRDVLFYILASLASALSALSIVLLIALLNPSSKRKWNYRMSAASLIDGWIENEVPGPSEAQFLRALAM